MQKKTIGIITGTRAEFGSLRSVIKDIQNSKLLDFKLFVTGVHLLPKFGNTLEEIKSYNYPNIIIVPMYELGGGKNELVQLGLSISNATKNFTNAFEQEKPDIILLLGDRAEVIAAGLSAVALKIPIAHIHGGDSAESGQIDEQIRHALTKFSHIHFTATETSKRRVLQMGEEDWRVHNVGAMGIDEVYEEALYSKKELLKKLALANIIKDSDDIILCVQHPSIADFQNAGNDIRILLNLLKDLAKHVILIYPNNDPGCQLIIDEIEKIRDNPNFHIFKNLNKKLYLSLMKHCLFMIGNSSSGVIESAVFKIPVINIGKRNLKRESSENVIHVSNTHEEISRGIEKVMSVPFREYCKTVINKYGDGTAGKKIVKILENVEIDSKLLLKKFILRNFTTS